PPKRGPNPLERGRPFGRLGQLQVLDHVGQVGDLLLEVALALLEPADPLLPVGEAASAPAETAVVSTSAHVHLPSSYLSRNPVMVCSARCSASAQRSRRRRPSAVSS